MPYHSLNFRAAAEADATGEIPVVLLTITHPDLAEPERLSTDPTIRLSTDPLIYGTRHGGQDFKFLPMGVQTPDQVENTSLEGALVIENMHAGLIQALRSVTTRATVDLAIVLASSPELVEEAYTGFVVTDASADVGSVEIRLGRDVAPEEPFPADRMTSDHCPGLRR
ncbi:MAG: hypothetical protein J0I31_19215 [Rhizobiales bacterium]|nr:hypothetical protein [Hyphomicrobiales bacterium]